MENGADHMVDCPAGHVFCLPCITAWRGQTVRKACKGSSCPTCRAFIGAVTPVALPPALEPQQRVLLAENLTGSGIPGKRELVFGGSSMPELHSRFRRLLQLSTGAAGAVWPAPGAPIAVRLEAAHGEFGEWVDAVTLAQVPAKGQLRVLLAEPGTPPIDAAPPPRASPSDLLRRAPPAATVSPQSAWG